MNNFIIFLRCQSTLVDILFTSEYDKMLSEIKVHLNYKNTNVKLYCKFLFFLR